METFDVIRSNLLSPLVLAFVLGIVATLIRSEVEIPEPIIKAISVYLLFSIGLNGGVELAGTTFAEFFLPALATIALAIAVPTWCYLILRGPGRFDIPNAAGIAAHYGSVSSVTLVAAISFVERLPEGRNTFEAFVPTLAALMEWGIIVALFIGRWRMGATEGGSLRMVICDTLTGRSVVLLLGGLLIGMTVGEQGFAPIKPLYGDLFRGVLVFFLIEMGMLAGRQLRDFVKVGPFMAVFGTVMPLIHGMIGVSLGLLAGLSPGGAFILGAITASASYIDAPAAVRATFPQANPSVYLTSSLGITLPINLILGLPLYYEYARWLGAALGRM
jgi:Predicted permease